MNEEELNALEDSIAAMLDEYFASRGKSLGEIKILKKDYIAYRYVSDQGNTCVLRFRRSQEPYAIGFYGPKRNL